MTNAKLLRLALTIALSSTAFINARAQEPANLGTISGRVIDAKSGQPLTEVGVQIVGLARGMQTGLDGRFRFSDVPAGTITLHVRRIGYQPKTITGLYLEPGRTLDQPVAMEQATITLATVVATADKERGTVDATLNDQRNATAIVNGIGEEQIKRSPDADAAQALQRVSGITVQDGKYLNVRGLDPRYTTASLNGARLPSPEPERKVVPFDIFPANLLQAVITTKTFTPDQPGDFSGGAVDLRTRENPGETQRSYAISIGANDAIMGRQIVTAPAAGGEWLAFGASPRRQPGVVAAAGFTQSHSQQDYNTFVSAFRNSWSRQIETGSPSVSANMSIGGTTPVGDVDLGYVGALTYAYGQEIRANEVRAFAVPSATGQGTDVVDRFTGTTGRTTALWGGVFNLSSLVGTRNRLTLNNTFTRSADNEARYEEGVDENIALPFQLTRLRYVQRAVFSSQLGGEHEPADGKRLEWSLTGSRVTRAEPDRSEVAYAIDETGGTAPFLFGGNEAAVRTFGELAEYNVNGTTDFTVRFGSGLDHLVKVGLLGRYTDRSSTVDSYSLEARLPREERERAPEEIFGTNLGPADSVFRLYPLSQAGSYTANDIVGAAFAMTEYQLGERIRLIGGARFEVQHLDVLSIPAFGSAESVTPTYADVLPALALNVTLTGRQMLRFSASQTLARPEYREIVPVASRDVLGGEQFHGNINLRRTLIQNADLRWELYPREGEVVSLALFAKRFDKPIERVYRGTSGTRVTTFENAKLATNLGAELELRKGLALIAEPLAPLTLFSNLTVMRSTIDIGGLGGGSVQEERAMVGQAPYVVNAGLTYATMTGGLSATALYNVIGRRIFAASLLPLPSVYEEARNVLDFSLRLPLRSGVAAKVDLKNVLDAPYEVTQGTVQREFYRAGRTMTVGLSWSN